VLVPYLRGFGPTQFLSASSMRSGQQQAALGKDLIDLLDALDIKRAILAGYDWGGLASCVATALWPERVAGLISYAGYDIIDVKQPGHSYAPSLEHVVWYQHLLQHERGRECLTLHRRDLCRILWRQWSPTWQFDEETFERTAASFDTSDFVDVVTHSYCFAFDLAAGDPSLAHFAVVHNHQGYLPVCVATENSFWVMRTIRSPRPSRSVPLGRDRSPCEINSVLFGGWIDQRSDGLASRPMPKARASGCSKSTVRRVLSSLNGVVGALATRSKSDRGQVFPLGSQVLSEHHRRCPPRDLSRKSQPQFLP
jgi:pimeloyl-ACP methyl ester carboxylesterase